MALVTGGGGYLGNRLCKELLKRGYEVTALDVNYFSDWEEGNSRIKQIKGDIRDYETVLSVLQEVKADVVFHLASFGMSGRDMLNQKLIHEVNINGTKNIIKACVETGTTRIVYTSTYNVVFGGQEIRDGNSSLPYFPIDQHVDHYSKTKSVAEQEVRKASGMEVMNKGKRVTLRTCALRCAGIYGEGEMKHLPRIVSYIERGLFNATYGSPDSLVEFLHADNFCQGHVKAAEAMLENNSPVIGNAYFISDGRPINNFIFFKPLVEGLGYSYPRVRLPLTLVFYVAFLIELVHGVVGKYIYNFQPLLTRAEVYKTGITHYFSMSEAYEDFGYNPEPRNLDGVIKWFKDRNHGRKNLTQSHCSKLDNKVCNMLLKVLVGGIAGWLCLTLIQYHI